LFSKVLVATDSSSASLAVIECAKGLQRLGTRQCVLAQSFLSQEHVPFPDETKAHITAALKRQQELLEKQGLQTTILVALGFPGTVIPRMATEQNCALIMVGSHGQSLASEMLLGSTATEIIHHATKPILLVPLKLNEKTGATACARGDCDFRRHVLYPTDFSDAAASAFLYVSELVTRGARRVTLLHVQDQTRLRTHLEHRLEEFNEIDRMRLEMLRDRLKTLGDVEVDMQIPYGSPICEILNRTAEGNASVVVMGTHGRGFISELFLGSVSHNVARHSETPVLLIPGLPART
jgi:nucleotide-binding universal stress UspA family protein